MGEHGDRWTRIRAGMTPDPCYVCQDDWIHHKPGTAVCDAVKRGLVRITNREVAEMMVGARVVEDVEGQGLLNTPPAERERLMREGRAFFWAPEECVELGNLLVAAVNRKKQFPGTPVSKQLVRTLASAKYESGSVPENLKRAAIRVLHKALADPGFEQAVHGADAIADPESFAHWLVEIGGP